MRDLVRQKLTQWQGEPDFAGLREPKELLKLSAEEREDCLALWEDVNSALERAAIVKMK